MDAFTKQSRETQVVIGSTLVYLLFSFFHWQSVSTPIGSAHVSEWEGIGVIAGLLAVLLLGWEVVRALEVKIDLATVSASLISLALALALLVFTVITFFSHNEFRKLPAWIGLVMSIVIAAAAWMRSQHEGVQMPDFSSGSSASATTAATTDAPPLPPAAASTNAPPPAEPASQDPPGV